MKDEWFIRGTVPMTKREVRSCAISWLELKPESVLWDVGAGTGSVGVEAAVLYPQLRVTAFEKKPEALALIRANCEKAGLSDGRFHIVAGTAPDCFAREETSKDRRKMGADAAPTHAFVGGSGGRMEEILTALTEQNPRMRIVVSAVTLQTLEAVRGWLVKRGRAKEAQTVLVQVSREQETGAARLLRAENPVFLISFGEGGSGSAAT